MSSLTVENYVKAIYQICQQDAGRPASTGAVASALGVSAGTVTSMVKTLASSGLVSYMPYEGVQLTSSGAALALRVLRRHRLIELFLSKTLALTWDEVHAEAENMEHAVSDLLVDRIDAWLGYPQVDPHGDPIPKADGTVAETAHRPLSTCAAGESIHLLRVADQSPEFLRFLTDAGLSLGVEAQVVANRRESGVICLSIGGRETSLGREVAEKLLVGDAHDGQG